MAQEPYNYFDDQEPDEEYRRRQAAKAKRRKKKRMQRIMLLAAFVLAAVLLVVCIIMIFRAIFKPKDDSSSVPSSVATSSVPYEPVQTGPGYDWPVAVDPDLWSLLLVNSQKPMESEYDYKTLSTIVQEGVTYYFDPRMVEQLQNMIAECNANEGYSLRIISGWRSFENQTKRHNYEIEVLKGQGHSEEEAIAMANALEPVSGCSDHHTALAVDFITNTAQQTGPAFATTPEYQWLMENAARFGFILRYPEGKEAITGISFLPYHWRYVGPEDAAVIIGSPVPICLEEYLAAMPQVQDALPPEDPTSDEGGEGDGSGEGGDGSSNAA